MPATLKLKLTKLNVGIQRDFEDICEADIRLTVEGSRPGSDTDIAVD